MGGDVDPTCVAGVYALLGLIASVRHPKLDRLLAGDRSERRRQRFISFM
jgi:hypothetical protein